MKFFKKSAKFLSLLLSVCMLLSVLPMVAFADGEEASVFNITVNEDGTTCTVTGFKEGCVPEVAGETVIPEVIDGYTVTKIGKSAFKSVKTLGKVTMPDTIVEICDYAFNYAYNMDIDTWPASLEKIGINAFDNAKKNGSNENSYIYCDFSNTKLKTLAKNALSNSGARDFVFPDTLESVSSFAMSWVSGAKDIVFPDSVKTIEKNALATNYATLKSVRFPENNTYTSINEAVIASTYPARNDRLLGDTALYIPKTITDIPLKLLKDFKDNATVTIYGEIGSAAQVYAERINALLEKSEYTNECAYGTGTEDDPYTDKDSDGKGELKEVKFIPYDFDLNVPILLDDNGIFNGENNIDIVNGTGNASPAVKTTEGGVFGKAESDLAYKFELNGENHTGFNYYEAYGRTLDTSILEISMAKPAESIASICITAAFYKTAEVADNVTIDGTSVSNRYSGSIIDFKADGIYIGDNPALKSEDKYTLLCKAQPEQWVTVAVIIPGSNDYSGGSDEVYVYINGTCYPIELIAPIYGTRHLRVAPTGKFEEPQVVYYDNIREYAKKDETYMPDKDKPASVEVSNLEVEGNEITIPSKMSVSVFKKFIKTDGFLRMYTDSSCKTELTDSDTAQAGNVVVVSTKNKRTTERVYTYYTLKEEVVELIEEPGIYNGEKTFTITTGEGNSNPAKVTKVGGIYGRTADDISYRIDAKGGNGGRNYFGTGFTLDTCNFELSFAHSANSMKMNLTSAFYITNSATDNITVDGKSVSNRSSGTLLVITTDSIRTSAHPALPTEWQNKTLAKIEPEKWINIAAVVPGSKQTGGSTDKIYIYINGEEFEIPLKIQIYGTRHLRFSPYEEYETEKTVYYDNVRMYTGSTESYAKEKDAQPVYDLSAVDCVDSNINVAEGTIVKQLKDKIFTTADIRVFNNSKYTQLLGDDDVIGRGNVLVFAANNRRVNYRAFDYFTLNQSVNIKNIKITNAGGKPIRGSNVDIKNAGEDYYLEAIIENKATSLDASLVAIVASYTKDGLLCDMDTQPVTITAGTNEFAPGKKEVCFKGVEVPEGGTLKGFLWMPETNEPMCENFEVEFTGKEEYQIIAFSNSYGNDAFTYLPAIGAAAGIDIYAVNMYTGGCTLSQHYNKMNGTGTYEKRIEYTPNGTISTENVSFEDAINTYGYAWDYITLQSKSTEAYNFKYYYTEEKPYITALADYIKAHSPKSELLFFQTWTLDTDTAKTSPYTKDLVAGLDEDQIRPTLFGLLKNNYLRAAEMIGNPGRMVPVGEAINYALEELGIPQFVKNESGAYVAGGRGMYRDTTCHLSYPYGRVLASLTWYEYLTGHDARENPYQISGIPSEDMALLKEAAHWACTRPEYNPQ